MKLWPSSLYMSTMHERAILARFSRSVSIWTFPPLRGKYGPSRASWCVSGKQGKRSTIANVQAGLCAGKNSQAMRLTGKSVSPRLVGKRPKPFDLLRRASPLRCSIGEGTRGGSPARMVDSRALCSPFGNVYFPECSLCNFSGRLFIICGKYTPFIRALCTLYECRLYKR